jgi:hypothetical protein
LGKRNKEAPKKETEHYIDFDLTVKDVILQIKNGFPSSFKECQESNFVTNSRTFVNSLVLLPEKLEQILQTVPSQCKYCDHKLDDWKHKGASHPISEFLNSKLKSHKIIKKAFVGLGQ